MSLQAKDEQSAMEEKYRNELNAHVKLSSLYKVRITAWHLGYKQSFFLYMFENNTRLYLAVLFYSMHVVSM